jgi:regulatory protein
MGGTITLLEVQQNNKERVNVYLDETFAFGLSALEAARLRKGQYLTDGEIAALKGRDVVEKSYERAVRFLGNRPRSAAEVRRNLVEKEVEATVIDEVLTRLESQGYVDDLAFARFWVSNRQQFKPRGARALRFELREKGVPQAVIDEVLADLDATESAYQAAQDKARRFRSLLQQDRRAFREKVGSFLTRRGFDYNTAREVIDRLINEYDSEMDGTDNVDNFDDVDDPTGDAGE